MKNSIKIGTCYTLHTALIIAWVCIIVIEKSLTNTTTTMLFTLANLIFCLLETRLVNSKRDNP